MQSKQPNVDAYLGEVPENRREALARLRDLCVETLEGYEEGMDYKMPCYKRPGGDVEVAFASQANHISLYVMRKSVLDRFRDDLTSANLGKGCIRYSTPEKMEFDVIRKMLEASATAEGRIC